MSFQFLFFFFDRFNILGIISKDKTRKILFIKKYLRKNPNKTNYIVTYIPIVKSSIQTLLICFGAQYKGFLLFLPSCYKIFKEFIEIQGPRIFMFICPYFSFDFIIKVNYLKTDLDKISFSIDERWYAFFLIFELNTDSLLLDVCKKIRKRCFFIQKRCYKVFFLR